MLRTVYVTIDAHGHLEIDVDGEPHRAGRECARSDLRSLLDEITTELGGPVRIEVREHDGTTYSDIALPPAADTTPPPDRTPDLTPALAPETTLAASSAPGLSGAGFRPGEVVAVAYVVCTQTASADGLTAVQLPPALLARSGIKMLLVGMTSAAIAEVQEVSAVEPT
ncbi:hypothetical protein [Nocardioides sp. YIM 152315]|uniref:hypothetical protein n=1 Tax=Nocardioides sp. YIM 152315 TaxID=3031760 RepID=UPI0023DB15C4|nr:hypothetical protein [Nocardioides sp. YIM 152315]MDF1605898.1 hypothetical protein [Nocardioides sp. YIM 152315]